MNKPWQLPRRTFLKGVGTAIALPALEAMLPPLRALALARTFPKRMAFVYIPNGANMGDWTPREAGTDFELPFILEPLKPFQKDLQVLSGLAHDKARANGDGAGDHARAGGAFLTGAQPRKTSGANFQAGVSADQVATLTNLVNAQVQTSQFKFILSPWTGKDFGHPIAVTAWRYLLYLDTADTDGIHTFADLHYGKSPEPLGGPAQPA